MSRANVLVYASDDQTRLTPHRSLGRLVMCSLALSAGLLLAKILVGQCVCHYPNCEKVLDGKVPRWNDVGLAVATTFNGRLILGRPSVDWVVLMIAVVVFGGLIWRRLRYRGTLRRNALWLAMSGASLVLATLGFIHGWSYWQEFCTIRIVYNGTL